MIRALSMRQPWAWATVHAGRDVDNRTTGTGWTGSVVLHAGSALSEHGVHDPRVLATWKLCYGSGQEAVRPAQVPRGAFIGVATLKGAHRAERGCCKPWGDHLHDDLPGDPRRYVVYHWQLADVLALPEPVWAPGRPGLWTPDQGLAGRLSRRCWMTSSNASGA